MAVTKWITKLLESFDDKKESHGASSTCGHTGFKEIPILAKIDCGKGLWNSTIMTQLWHIVLVIGVHSFSFPFAINYIFDIMGAFTLSFIFK